jgi:hypothetical protein
VIVKKQTEIAAVFSGELLEKTGRQGKVDIFKTSVLAEYVNLLSLSFP